MILRVVLVTLFGGAGLSCAVNLRPLCGKLFRSCTHGWSRVGGTLSGVCLWITLPPGWLLTGQNPRPCAAEVSPVIQLQLVAVDYWAKPTGGHHLVPQLSAPDDEDALLRPKAELEVGQQGQLVRFARCLHYLKRTEALPLFRW